jgi:hypothetical protein
MSSLKEADIALHLANYRYHMQRYEIMLPNVYIQRDSEADLFCVRKSGLCDEFEIKISKADFRLDSKKVVRYRELERDEWKTFRWNAARNNAPNMKTKYNALIDGDLCVNYFWYVVPEDLIGLDEVPEFAGLIYVSESGVVSIKRSPKRLHGTKLSLEEKYKIARKSTYRYWKLRNRM